MKTKIGPMLVLAAVAAATVAAAGCSQPKPKCGAGRGTFIGKYKLTSGPTDVCGTLKGELLGVQVYNPVGKRGNPDLDRNIVAIKTRSVGQLVDRAFSANLADPNPDHKPYALGEYTTAEPVDDFCAVPTFAPAEQDLPSVPEQRDADGNVTSALQPATSVKNDWSNYRAYVVPQAVGLQFTAHLARTQDGVTCEYDVVALYPAVDCSATDPTDPDKTLDQPDSAKCAPEADVAAGRPTGSGINPDFATTCDPELLYCVLTGEKLPVLL